MSMPRKPPSIEDWRVTFKDGSPPLTGQDAAEFVVRRIQSGNTELPEILLHEELEVYEAASE